MIALAPASPPHSALSGEAKPRAEKYFLATFGCQMNEYDSNMVGSMLERRGLALAEEPGQADLLIVNTCSIRGGAEERAYARIASMRHYKRMRPEIRIAVIGCMAQNHGEKIQEKLEHVDYVVGPDNYRELERLLFTDPVGATRGSPLPDRRIWTAQNDFENYPGHMARLDGSVSCHVAVSRGCNKQCAYCIVPKVRGVERSRPVGEVLEEIRRAVDAGVREVCLLGQTVNSYRTETDDFASLLRRVNAVEGLRRIRFTSPHPRHFDAETVRTMAECEKVCRHVHLPLQSGSDAVLKRMRRQYTRERFLEITAELRAAIPDLAITTDIIAGFAGETADEFEETLSLMRAVRFDHAFMFAYSPREGTPAWEEKESLTPGEKQERLERVIALQMRITEECLDARVGRVEEVLIEERSSRDSREWVGKTSGFKRVVLPDAPGLGKGIFARASILERRGLVLRGEAA